MNESLRETINRRFNLITRVFEQTDKALRNYPDGRIKIERRGTHVYYYLSQKGNEVRLIKKSETELLSKLLQKCYLEKIADASKNEMDSLEKMLKHYPKVVVEDVYEQLPDERKTHVKPIIPTDEQLVSRWLAEPYKKKPISEDVPIFETKRGERVRSKSEMIIANMLYDYGIPYKYECPINVGGEIIHPDFTILRLSDRKIIYYEHCGRMGDPGYVEDMIDRSRKYTFAGIYQGDKLFYTFESAKQPLDVRVVSEMIEKNFR